MIERWRLWYDDGSFREGASQAEWDAAPATGVIFGMWFFSDRTAAIVCGHDLYWRQDFGKGPIYADSNDRDGLLHRLPWVKFGQWTTHDEINRLTREANALADAWAGREPAKDCGCGAD